MPRLGAQLPGVAHGLHHRGDTLHDPQEEHRAGRQEVPRFPKLRAALERRKRRGENEPKGGRGAENGGGGAAGGWGRKVESWN